MTGHAGRVKPRIDGSRGCQARSRFPNGSEGNVPSPVRGFRAPGCLESRGAVAPRAGTSRRPRAPLDTVESRYTVEPRPTVRGRTREPPLEPPQRSASQSRRDLNLAKNYRGGAWLRNPRSCRRAPSCPRAPTSCIRTRTGRNPSSMERRVPRRTPKTRSFPRVPHVAPPV